MRTTPSRVGRLAGAAVATLALGAAVPTAASAAPYTCEASAVRGSVLARPAVEPVVANRDKACTSARAGGTDVVPAAITAGALSAVTSLAGAEGPQRDQAAVASGGVAGLRVAPLPDLGLGPVLEQALAPARQAVAALPPTLPVGATLPVLGAVEVARVDVRGFATALLDAAARLPAAELLRLDAASSTAAARCTDGTATPAGASQVSGLRVLGQDLPANEAVTRTLALLAAGSIDPSTLTADDAVLGRYVTLLGGLDLTAVKPLLQPLLDALPTIDVPALAATVKLTPAQQIREGDTLIQRALRVEVGALGQSLLDLTIGEAAVGAPGIDCAAPQQETAADLALACTTRRLVLVDVIPSGDRVRLFGAADRRLAGRTVDVVFQGTGRRVARAKVAKDGSFRTTAAMPSRRLRSSDRARYQARLGRERSLNLKLERRMRVRSITSRDGRVSIRGRVTLPLARPVQAITLRRRLSCRRSTVVKRFRPRSDGTFEVTVAAPGGVTAAVYRLSTTVRRTTRNPKRFATFTLPRGVNLLG